MLTLMRGLLLVYGSWVFGDTSEDVDESNCLRFLFVSIIITSTLTLIC